MRNIRVKQIKDAMRELCLEANFNLRQDILAALKKALRQEKNKRSKRILSMLIENAAIAKKERRAICQDTGAVSVYISVGQDVRITGGDFEKAIQEGVREAYRSGHLRKSIVESPIKRKNTGTNTPVVIHTEIVKGKKLKMTVLPKGFGSENKSSIKMMKPTDSEKEIISFVTETAKGAGADACPPYVIGVGLGGTFDKAAWLSKMALTIRIDRKNPRPHLRKLEEEILKKLNTLNIGPMGLGGKMTCLGINVLEYPTHIAGLPVAVNISCHATRSASKIL